MDISTISRSLVHEHRMSLYLICRLTWKLALPPYDIFAPSRRLSVRRCFPRERPSGNAEGHTLATASLIASDTEHLFMCSLAICVPSLVKCFFVSLACFLIELSVSCWVLRILSIHWTPTFWCGWQVVSPGLSFVFFQEVLLQRSF